MPSRKASSGVNNVKNRVKRELTDYNRNQTDQSIYFVEPLDEDLLKLKGHIFGAPNSPFASAGSRAAPASTPNPPRRPCSRRSRCAE